MQAPSLSEVTIGTADTPPWLTFPQRNGTLARDEEHQLPLTLDATTLEPGIYNTTLTLRSEMIENTYHTNIQLTVGESNDLHAWLDEHGIPHTDAMHDTDKDGHTNLTEYVFGGNPHRHDALIGLPRIRKTNSNPEIEMTVRQNLPAGMLIIETSADLRNWDEAKINVNIRQTSKTKVDADHEQILLELLDSGATTFVRATIHYQTPGN